MSRQLAVLMYGRRVGTLGQTDGGEHVFVYAEEPGGTPLSLSMPLGRRTYRHAQVDPYIDGLLPDRLDLREAMGRELGVSGRNPFALLEETGLDCSGGVQFVPSDKAGAAVMREGSLVPMSDRDIAGRLRRLRIDPTTTWAAPRESWSLAGAQGKLALRRTSEGWASAQGSEPTTHILKPGVQGFRDQALNEHICLATASALGLPAAATAYTEFDGEPAVVVTRYDRRIADDGRVVRLHQEDMCQALSVPPGRKYESDRGPTATQIVDLLRRESRADHVSTNLARFTDALLFNYLTGSPDAHAKNYSVLLGRGFVRLAPLYDVASGMPYDSTEQSGLRTAAMSIGGERVFGQVQAHHWLTFAARARLDGDRLLERVRELAGQLPDAMHDVIARDDLRKPAAELGPRLLDGVSTLCALTLAAATTSSRRRSTLAPGPSSGT